MGIKEGDGTNRECTDFSKQTNFPKAIAQAIKDVWLTYGIDDSIVKAILTAPAYAKYNAICDQAFCKLVRIKKNRNTDWQ